LWTPFLFACCGHGGGRYVYIKILVRAVRPVGMSYLSQIETYAVLPRGRSFITRRLEASPTTGSVCGEGVGQYRANVIGRLGKGVAMNKLRTLADVLRQAGFARITGLFLIFYLLCSTAVWLSEPTTLTFGDGLWFSFETVSTIGFGDIPAETPVARAITVVLGVISIFYIAMLTGVAVNYCNTLIKLRQKDTMARFMDDLEHLEELDRDELADLSRRVREYRRRQR
jgi:voltage-gated potassium channel